MIPVRNHSGSVSVKAKMDIVVIRGALDEYALNNKGAYPSSLQPLVTPDTNGKAYLEGYNGIVPKDPWGHEYRYDPPTADHPRPRVWSFGADGKVGGSGADKDIYSDS
jgi:general secretion pathway protein G